MRLLALSLGFLLACSQGPTDQGDGGPDADMTPEAGDEGASDASTGRCNPMGAFGTATALTSLNTSKADRLPRLSPDELAIYFWVDDGQNKSLFTASRKSVTVDFGLPIQLFPGAQADDWSPSVSADGLHLWFVRLRYGYIYAGIFESARMSTTDAWGTPVTGDLFPDNGLPDAFVTPDGKTAYWSNPVNAVTEVHRTPLRPMFGPDMMVPGLGIASAPTVSPDDLVIYYSGSSTTVMKNAIFRGSRPDTSASFGGWQPIKELDSAANEEPGWISPDDCVLYFSSNRSGNYDLYVARRGQ